MRSARVVAIATSILALVAIAALAIAILTFERENAARGDARRDSCKLFKGLVLTATPKARAAAAQRFIAESPLRDCNHYANHP